jgi:hypothetical protein
MRPVPRGSIESFAASALVVWVAGLLSRLETQWYHTRTGKKCDMAFSESIAQAVRRFVLSNSKSKRHSARRAWRSTLERLESRTLLSVVPAPIVPSTGELNQIAQAVKHAAQTNTNALDNDPVPFAVQFSGGSAAPQVVNWHAGAPLKLDVDNNKATGNGGNDIQVDVETVLTPTPHLTMEIDRLAGPFAQNVNVLIAFPFNAFNTEVLPSGMPNLVIGYQTTAAGGGAGGTAPATELITFTPHILGGTNHLFDLNFATTGASNPVIFETGEFDGLNTTGPLNARVITANVQNVPASINIGLNVAQSALATLPSSGSIGVTWDASAATPVTFGYLEDVSVPNPALTNFGTTLSFNQMPTHEQISLAANEAAGTITVSSQSNAVIGAITLNTTRSDGLTITGTASGVPTALDITFGMAGTVVVNTHGSTLGGLQVTAQQTGGFVNTSSFLGYNIGYAQLGLTNVPSLTAGFIPGIDQYGVLATVPGTSIGSVSILISKDSNVQLPPSGHWNDPNWDIFSLIDDGTTGTAAARMDNIQQATFNANPTNITELFTLITTAADPMEAYLKTTATSNLIPGHDVEVTADIQNFPSGAINFAANLPLFGYTTTPPQTIGSIHVFGHIDSTFFDIDAGSLPPVFAIDFDPDTHATVKAEDGFGNSATVGHIGVHFWNPNGTGLSGSGFLFSTPLNDAEIRFDSIPSLHATWTNSGSTTINFNPDVAGFFVGGAQLDVSTSFGLAPLVAGVATSQDSVALTDLGTGAKKELSGGAFGISSFALSTDDPNHKFHLNYAANQAHVLTADFDSVKGGRYFSPFDVQEHLGIVSVPGSFDILSDFSTTFKYTATDVINSLSLSGFFGNTLIGAINTTFLATGLPAVLDFEYPGSSATLDMSGAIGQLAFGLSNDSHGMFGTPYRLVTATLTNIPAHWSADWSGSGVVVEATDTSHNPAPMGVVKATVSTSTDPTDNNNFLHPFQISGPGGARINYSPFAQDVDNRFYQAGGHSDSGAATLAVLHDLYFGANVLGAGEDHAVAQINGGSLAFFDAQFTGFQKLVYQPNSDGGHYEFADPVAGVHPFLAGVGLDSNYLIAHIDNVPDSAVLDINLSGGNIHFHTSNDFSMSPTSSVGNIDVYYGPAGLAQDADTALRAIMQNVPDDVVLSWGFGFPDGSANFTASNEFRLLLLAQDGSHRLVAGLQLQEMEAGYSLAFTPGVTVSTTAGFIPTSVNLKLFTATAGIDNDTADSSIAANNSKPGISGIFNLYSLTDNPENINDGTPAGAKEYTPELTVQLKDFRLFSVDLTFSLGLFPDLGAPHIGGPDIHTSGQFALQLWSTSDIDDEVDLTDVDLSIYGFENKPDYVDNTPFFIIPFGSPDFSVVHDDVVTFGGFGNFGDLFDPFL